MEKSKTFKPTKNLNYFSDKLKIKLDNSFLASLRMSVIIQIQRGSLVLEE